MPKDPTDPIRRAAGKYAGVDEGSACTQSAFKIGTKAFLYIGPQGGRFKAMFKLDDSIPEATRLAQEEPDRFEVGKSGWVTARFSAEEPLARTIWKPWLDESAALATGPAASSARKTAGKKTAGKKKAKKKPRT